MPLSAETRNHFKPFSIKKRNEVMTEGVDISSLRYNGTDIVSSVNGISSFQDKMLISTVNGINK